MRIYASPRSGANGTNGTNGVDGADGQGVPLGGTPGQLLVKAGTEDFNTYWSSGIDTSNYVSGTQLIYAITTKMQDHESAYDHSLIADTSNFVSGTELNYAVTTKMATHEAAYDHTLIADTSNFVSGTQLNTAVINKMNIHEAAYAHNTFASGTELNTAVTLKMNTHEAVYDHSQLANFANLVSGTELNYAVTTKMNTHESTYDHTKIPSTGFGYIVYKTADESVTSSTVLQDDNHLLFAMKANTKYAFRFYLMISIANATPDIKIALSGPASPTNLAANVATSNGGGGWNTGVGQKLAATDWSDYLSVDIGAASDYTIGWLEGTVENGANAGDLKLQWAQRASSATATTIIKGSYLEYWEIP